MSIVPRAETTEPRNATPTFRCTDAEHERIIEAAKHSGHKPAVFMRLAVMAAVEASEAEQAAAKPARKKGGG